MHIWVEKILEGNTTKCFSSYLGIVDLCEGFLYLFFIFQIFYTEGALPLISLNSNFLKTDFYSSLPFMQ